MEKFKILGKTLEHHGRILDFYTYDLKVPNGNITHWDVLEHKGASAIIPVDEDGKIILNNKRIKMIEDILRKYITDVHVIKYDKDIDISKIVTNTHLMISDKMGVIYLISYVANGDYPIDNDIESSMLNLLKK